MQSAKDSFYMALQARLAALNPARTVTMNGVTRPAVIVLENELLSSAELMADAFYIEWGQAALVDRQAGSRALVKLACAISYFSSGTCDSTVDRGRMLATLDIELFRICEPPSTAKCDFSQAPTVDLGTCVFWTRPQLDQWSPSANPTVSARAGSGTADLPRHLASISVFFFPEVNLL